MRILEAFSFAFKGVSFRHSERTDSLTNSGAAPGSLTESF
ncbi:hypothetical protein PAECIP111891_04925 [Paenibacillus allorhizoplanae]|uniref:Uncharacterized protein n=1 Tax=Paenibacillus allorhizoplanae TaxID=2905648 RepID=A0ABM9CNQ1_9BACL|nr:hypothetical protein PAECIP111891_04925 [Paenibacillus allorhizoplanae]